MLKKVKELTGQAVSAGCVLSLAGLLLAPQVALAAEAEVEKTALVRQDTSGNDELLAIAKTAADAAKEAADVAKKADDAAKKAAIAAQNAANVAKEAADVAKKAAVAAQKAADIASKRSVGKQYVVGESNKKASIARDFYGMDKQGKRIMVRYPTVAAPVDDVPDWSLLSMVKLGDYGLLSPTDIRDMQSAPDRNVIAKLISRAYNQNNAKANSSYHYEAELELEKLMVEYDNELRNLGYGAEDYVLYTKIREAGTGSNPEAANEKFQLHGEIRDHYVDHSGDDPFNFYDHHLRMRLYADYSLDGNWTLHAMTESIKDWANGKHDRLLKLDRFYVSGWLKQVFIKAGAFGTLYADGNVYDGKITGVSAITGDAIKYRAEYGELRDGEKGGAVIASYSEPKFDVEAGMYSFDDVKGYGRDTIVSLGYNRYVGNYEFGAMYLKSTKKDSDGNSDGFVLTAKNGRLRTWIPGTYEAFVKYYDQAHPTYISHTMSGLGDYMHGFKGVGAGFSYAFARNWVYDIEYYYLTEKTTSKHGRTIWNHVAYYF